MKNLIINHPHWAIDSELKPVLFKPHYAKILKNINAGILLSQIIYWWKPTKTQKLKVSVIKNNKLWIAKSRELWMEETGLSLDQYKASISILKNLELIIYKSYGFGGKVTPHIHLCLDELEKQCKHCAEITESILTKSKNPLCPKGTFQPNQYGNSPQSIGEMDSDSLVDSTPTIDDQWCKSHQSNKENNLKENNGKEYGNGQAVLNKPKTPKTTPKEKQNKVLQASKANSQTSIEISPNAPVKYWEKMFASNYSDYQKPLTGKDRTLIRNMVNEFEEANLGLDWQLWIKWINANWGAFAWQAKIDKGWNITPSKPEIGFLYINREILVKLVKNDLFKADKPENKKTEFETDLAQEAADKLEEEKEVAKYLGMTLEDYRAAAWSLYGQYENQSPEIEQYSETKKGTLKYI